VPVFKLCWNQVFFLFTLSAGLHKNIN